MKHLILVLNGKGGVGKSFFALNLVQFFIDRAIEHVAIDSDNENSTLKRFHPQSLFVDLATPKSLDQIFSALDKHQRVVVDARAASTDHFLGYFEEINLPEVLEALAGQLTLAMPVNHELDSVDQIQRVSDQLQGKAQYVIIRNASHGERFTLFDSSEVRTVLKHEYCAREIGMPRLQDWLVELLHQNNCTPTAALKNSSFSLLDRQRMVSWQRRFYAELETLLPLWNL